MSHKVVVRGMDGSIIKGFTDDFSPAKKFMHVLSPGRTGMPHVVPLYKIKAIFFVKEFDGSKDRSHIDGFQKKQSGHEVFVEFKDGEKMWGYSESYQPEAEGFFLFPADHDSNNVKVYVFNASVEYVLIS